MIKDLCKLLIIGVVIFTTGFALKSVGFANVSLQTAGAAESEHLTFTTTDGLILHAWKDEALPDTLHPDAKPALALLLPMRGHTHESFEPFRMELNKQGYTTIAFDLRGHGLSTTFGKNDERTISYTTMPEADYIRIPSDIQSFFSDFKSKNRIGYDYDRVAVIGASIGANAAGMLTDHKWVKQAVMLSPGRDYRGMKPELVMMAGDMKHETPIYIAASEDDTYALESSQWLFDQYDGPKVFKKYPGSDHGTDILRYVKNADTELLEWLKD